MFEKDNLEKYRKKAIYLLKEITKTNEEIIKTKKEIILEQEKLENNQEKNQLNSMEFLLDFMD